MEKYKNIRGEYNNTNVPLEQTVKQSKNYWINGRKFTTFESHLTPQQLCDKINVPFGNASIYINEGPFSVPSLTHKIPINNGDSFEIIRNQVLGG